MYNKIILVGNLTRDIDLKYTPSGTAVAKFGLATNRVYNDSITKEKKQEAMFIDITVFGRVAETANQYLKKGSQVLIEGRLTLNQWTDQTGQKRSKHEIIAEQLKFLGGKDSHQNSGGYNQSQNQQQTANQSKQPIQQQNNNSPVEDEEGIPF